jgi:hypothetical protein
MARRRINPPRKAQAKGARIVSAFLENADVFKTGKGGGRPTGPAVLVLRRRPDFHRADFDRKARDLVRLGNEGRLSKAASNRTLLRDRKTGQPRTVTNVHRDRVIRRLTRNGETYRANRSLVDKLYRGKRGDITEAGQALDPDHIQDLQLRGADRYDNLRLMDAWTNRQLGSDIATALRDVPEGTPIIVKVIP